MYEDDFVPMAIKTYIALIFNEFKAYNDKMFIKSGMSWICEANI